MKRNLIIIFLVVVLTLGVLATRLFLGGNEDDWICENGQWVQHGHPSALMPSEGCGNQDVKTDIQNSKSDLIVIDQALGGATIQSPLTLTGKARGAWFFEASFPIKLVDKNGDVIATAIAQAKSDWMTEEFVPFEAQLVFSVSETQEGEIVFEKDNPSGLAKNADELRIPVQIEKVADKITVKVYFNNNKLDPEYSCNKVFSANRQIESTQSVAKAALTELLAGPTEEEKKDGFFSSINQGVVIQKLTIENGVAKVDFNEKLEEQAGGSCRVSAIRTQITETLKQFATVDSVIISINGRTEDILQP